jgi:hypothetical protein
MTSIPICFRCKYFQGATDQIDKCAAFPEGIPDEILLMKHNHRKPYPGDHGIRFEPKDESK